MYLKSLELFGFKSFPDRTVLNFDKGATVIVGPNGSGKSNISDAMRWVLGEISSRSIRGTRMEDVIFGGTDDRKQMSFAEVSVTFDNTDRQMDIPYDEVSVTRRYLRRGESEYFINRRPVRLKDIHELFMNTGVGREGYSIIGQGRIAEIISQKSSERRSIFEEAAGISKYRYKKEEAEGKLSGVDDNLTRLRDILSELGGRVGPLERESEKARKYLEYYEIKKRDDISLWLYDSDRLREELREAKDRLTLAEKELEISAEALESLENQNERVFEASQEAKLKYEELQTGIDGNVKSSHSIDSEIQLTENDILHRERQISERNEANTRLGVKREALLCQRDERERILAAAGEHAEEISRTLALVEEDGTKTKAERDALSERLDAALSDMKRAEEKLVELKIRLSVLDTTKKSESEKQTELDGEIKRYGDSTALLEGRAEKAEKAIAQYRKKGEELAAESARLAAESDRLSEKKQELIDKSNGVYLEYTAKKHRIDAIRRMEELFEGYAQSVRFVMNEYDAGHIEGTKSVTDPTATGGRIFGPVSRLINVSARYTLAIETALGANIQNIVVDDEEAAKAAISHLKRKNAGRATFYPISSMKPRFPQIPDAECRKYAGYLGTADSVIGFDDRFGGVIRNILGATLIFDNIDNASVMAKATGYKVRVVTLDGQIINAGGSFTGGSAKRDSGMLTRRTETEKLKRDSEELSAKLEELRREQASCETSIEKLKKENSALASQMAMLQSLIGAENTQLEVMKNQLSGEKGMRESLIRDLEELKAGAAEREESAAALRAEADSAEASRAEAVSLRERGVCELGELSEKIELLEERRSELLIKRAEAMKDVELASHDLDETNARISENEAEAAENSRICSELAEENRSAGESLAAKRSELDALRRELDVLETERRQTSDKNLEYEQRLSQLRVKLRDASSKKELCFREHTLADSKYKSLTAESDKQTSRLWEDYELTYSGALELGYPAVTQENRSALAAELAEYRSKLKALGSVNLSSIEEYADVKERFDFMNAQIDDLEKSRTNLLEIIIKLEGEMRESFSNAFAEIDRNFKLVFRELFGGGDAELSLTDPMNVLESGIEIRVAPPGKIIKSLTLLSGGEQAFVAIALIFAILRVNPTPFCIFDEIEAALDEANVFRFADYVGRYSDRTQFIIITHRRGTMETADRIYGVTMQERGISRVLALDISKTEEQLGRDGLA